MRKPIINYNDDDFEEAEYLSIFEHLWYKGQPFTGTLLEDDGKSYTEYVNGCADGRCLEYYEDGQLASDWTFEAGTTISEKEWYRNGQLRKDDRHLYLENGRPIRINNSWLYLNDQVINEHKQGLDYYFSPQGELAIKVVRSIDCADKDTHIYYDGVLSKCFLELFFNYYPQMHEYAPVSDSLIWGWAMKKLDTDAGEGWRIFDKLANYNDKRIANIATHLLNGLKDEKIIRTHYLDSLNYRIVIL